MSAKRPSGADHQFGGDWTRQKLAVLSQYLTRYTTALKNQPFATLYIDAFAGSGYLTASSTPTELSASLFDDSELAESDAQAWLDGSARIALKTEPRFGQYVFVDRHAKRCDDLRALRDEFSALAEDIYVHQGDANETIAALCATPWRGRRAVLFLDPYGMQVEWSTIAAIAQTKAIDMFLLFPLGIGVNRLLTKDGNIPAPWRTRLNLLLGSEDWYDEFYSYESVGTSLFDDTPEQRLVKASTATIGKYFNDRLRTIFAEVAGNPLVLTNTRGCPLYLLCFAAGNPKGAPIAIRIAEHILGKATRTP